MSATSPIRRNLLRAAVALSLAAAALPASAYWNPPAPQLARVDVYDRTSGAALPVHAKDGRSYVVGTPGHEYAIRIRNCTGSRILAVTSVDGVNVLTGETASPDQSGYVIEPWGSVEIAGWRKSMQRVATFYFSEHSQSYAARTGRPFDVGVVGVAVFAEKAVPVARITEPKRELRAQEDAARAEPSAPAAGSAESTQSAVPPASSAPTRTPGLASRGRAEDAAAPAPMAKLGTGHGRSETSHARRVDFVRATSEPAQVIALQYDRYENLVALGVIQAPSQVARVPRPFPGMRFVPDPR